MVRFNGLFWQQFMAEFFADLTLKVVKPEPLSSDLIQSLRDLWEDARSASVSISANDELEDLQTSSLLFALIPFALGYSIYYRTQYKSEGRLGILKETCALWNDFLRTCYQLELIKQRDMSCRTTKIESVKRQSLLKDSIRHVSVSKDLDESRQHVVDMLEFFGIQCQVEMRFVEDEIQMLMLNPDESLNPSKDESIPKKKPWSIRLNQDNIRSLFAGQVFKPDIAMPTVSLAEFAEQEMRRIKAATPEPGLSVDDVDFYKSQRESELREAQKERAWDDWKDDNPRGSGNKMGNIG